jgi:hypothetical protein
MLPYTIDDQIKDPEKATAEVTVDFGNGNKRWCFFITPQQLAPNGSFVEGTKVRMHLGVTHMIVVSELTETIIENVLNELFVEQLLEEHTIPLV